MPSNNACSMVNLLTLAGHCEREMDTGRSLRKHVLFIHMYVMDKILCTNSCVCSSAPPSPISYVPEVRTELNETSRCCPQQKPNIHCSCMRNHFGY